MKSIINEKYNNTLRANPEYNVQEAKILVRHTSKWYIDGVNLEKFFNHYHRLQFLFIVINCIID